MEAEDNSTAGSELLLEEAFDRLYERLKREEEKGGALQWGGFFRRALALLIDLVVLALFSAAFFYLTYVAYSVGLAANQESLSSDNPALFFRLLGAGWIALGGAYFVLLHGGGGRTVGKWLLGLRVVGPGRERVTYGQALVRCAGSLLSALFFGLGFFSIVLSREKRGWHDFLARTWVVRE